MNVYVSVDLMGLLKWRDNPAGLQQHLLSFMRVDGEEVVKVILWAIMEDRRNVMISE